MPLVYQFVVNLLSGMQPQLGDARQLPNFTFFDTGAVFKTHW